MDSLNAKELLSRINLLEIKLNNLYSNKDSSYDEHIYNLFKYGYDFISYCYAVWGFISAKGYENLGYTTGYIKDEPLIINFLPVNE